MELLGKGSAVLAHVWLDDGSETTLTAPGGVELARATLTVRPAKAGRFGLHAAVFDAAGCFWQTGVVRIVQVF